LDKLLYSEKNITGGYSPYLTFNVLVQSNIFSVHQYKCEYPERESIRNKVWELHKEGWGYTKIKKKIIIVVIEGFMYFHSIK